MYISEKFLEELTEEVKQLRDINRVKHIDMLKNFGYPLNKMLIMGSGTLALYGIRSNKDIDIVSHPSIWKKVKKDRRLKPRQIMNNDTAYETKNGELEFGNSLWPLDIPPFMAFRMAETVNGFKFQSLKDVLAWKKKMGREKDAADIALIKKFMKQHKIKL